MSKHIASSSFYSLPSGIKVHPCRLIFKDGTLMWKHALLSNNVCNIPTDTAHEQHIIKTAQRIEELNSWISPESEDWDNLKPFSWYVPSDPDLSEGISLYFYHPTTDIENTYEILKEHILSHETHSIKNQYLFFKRC